MKTVFLTLACLMLLGTGARAQGEVAFLRDFLPGAYRVVGKRPDSSKAYTGRVVIRKKDRGFEVIRNIMGKSVTATGLIETATADRIKVLRVRFVQGGQRYEATYLIHSDLDNYARLTGFVYPQGGKTADPGLEALFFEHRQENTAPGAR